MTKTFSHEKEMERLNHLLGERLAAARVITTDRKETNQGGDNKNTFPLEVK